jgi:phosphatidylserine/phosphatidylglycerophosphate/cardiolipin synthase-like enzyme
MKIPTFVKKNNLIIFLFSLGLGIVITLFASNTLYAKTEVLFSPKGSIKETILKTIISLEETIDVAAFTFTSGDIAEALYNAKERGVKIRLVIDQGQDKGRYPVLEFLKEEGFDLQFLKGNIGGSMNNTFAIFDGKLLATGSYNWTEYSEKFNYENVIFIDDLDVIGKYKNEFDSLYNEGVAQGAKREEGLESHVDVPGAAETESAVSGEGTLSGQGNVHKTKHKGVKGAIPDDKVSAPVAVTGSRDIKKPEEIQKVKPVIKPQKQFSNTTFDEFDKIFGSESKLTKLEKKHLWEEEYEGKYVSWTGKVGFKGGAIYDWNKVGIIHKGSKVDVNLKFDYSKKNKVLNLKVEDVVTYTGRLISLKGLLTPYRLDDVDFFQVR